MATKYFKGSDKLMVGVQPCISESINEKLTVEFKTDEIIEAMNPFKASSKDGFQAFFYHKYWHIIGGDVVSYYLDVLNGRKDIEEINRTNIVRIPKVTTPKNMGQFRPINFCNVIYKIISKVVVNRRLYPKGKLPIILVAYEILHSFKKKTRGVVGSFALKLDMSKAYDRVE
ncbi:reverse transcriptase [Gossypium australe]|uniref:Reverse transcriptase n=1 Tax=Gossypium australe TaxID=47621 RepID=A0A5B6X3F7_9ROSI|nr:reverse transcriptase [Gossypium australe]